MKEEIKDKLTDLYKVLAIVLGILGFIGMFFIPEIYANIIVFLVVAGLNIWVISKIIARYKNMTRKQRQGVMYYCLFLVLGVILMIMAYIGMFDRWVKNEDIALLFNLLGPSFIGSSLGVGLNACHFQPVFLLLCLCYIGVGVTYFTTFFPPTI